MSISRADFSRQTAALVTSGGEFPLILDTLSQIVTIVFWAGEDKKLGACDLCVLIFLIQRQNTKTGRCDPSVECLMKDTGYSERSVRASITKLDKFGAIKRLRKGKWERNRFLIRKIDKEIVFARLKHKHPHQANVRKLL